MITTYDVFVVYICNKSIVFVPIVSKNSKNHSMHFECVMIGIIMIIYILGRIVQ